VTEANARVTATELRTVLRAGTQLIDVRSPGEFARGALPTAVNLPVLDDEERAAVGTTYRKGGQGAAIALGEDLVSGAVRADRVAAWRAAVTEHPDSVLYCWRGGLRSQIVQQWLAEAGCRVPLIEGGFKALRRACLEIIDEFAARAPLWVIGGRTGSGKTALLSAVPGAIDLEGLANHRGSAFGAAATPQPTPVDFENALAVRLLHLEWDEPALVEDESRTIGRLAIPEPLHAAMQRAPLAIVEVDRAARAAHIWKEYVEAPLAAGIPEAELAERYLGACDRIKRRLGGLRHGEIRGAIESAFRTALDPAPHQGWIAQLLEHYYDPMYDYQLSRKADRVAFTGTPADVVEFIKKINIDIDKHKLSP
jgi:tRNA 2-selenouridine synthase